jgi:hypothetical protein
MMFLLQGGHAAKQMAASNAVAGLGSHLKLSLYRLRLHALGLQNEGSCHIMKYTGMYSSVRLRKSVSCPGVQG